MSKNRSLSWSALVSISSLACLLATGCAGDEYGMSYDDMWIEGRATRAPRAEVVDRVQEPADAPCLAESPPSWRYRLDDGIPSARPHTPGTPAPAPRAARPEDRRAPAGAQTADLADRGITHMPRNGRI